MEKVRQIAVQVPNRPGVLQRVTRALSEHGVNIVAVLLPESLGTGILRLIPDDMEKAEEAFNDLQYIFTTETVLSLRMTNKPGELAQVTDRLARARIGIEFLYATTDGVGRAERVIVSVSDLDGAVEVLKDLGM
jgi:hypothetical protein